MSSPASARAALWPLLRSRLRPDDERSPADVWIQAVSVGEVEVAGTLVDALRARRPELGLLVTSTTPAGVALARRRFPEGCGVVTRPFPLDLPRPVRRFFQAAESSVLVLVETELWPAVLREAGRRATPVLLVNGRLSARSAARYRLARRLFHRPLQAITHVLARTAEDAGRFASIGVPEGRITVAGDMKLDRPSPDLPPFSEVFRRLSSGRPVLVCGSLADAEVPVALEVWRRLKAQGLDVFLLVAPRRPASFHTIEGQLRSGGLRTVARSSLAAGETPGGLPDAFLLDTLGELSGSYLLGDAALLGGTFAPRGGHNVLEPLRAGLPTVHGPSISNIQRSLELAQGAVFGVEGAAGAAAELFRLLADPQERARVASIAHALFERHAGATGRAAQAVLDLLDGAAP